MNIHLILNGGLGNQMFEYAFARSLSLDLEGELYLDDSNLKSHAIKRDYSLNLFPNINRGKKPNTVRNFQLNNFNSTFPMGYYDSILSELQKRREQIDCLVVNGYFQSVELFRSNANSIRKDFEIPIKKISTNKTPVVIQVRRTDFVGSSVHEVCTIDYYNKAIMLIEEKVENPLFIIVSEDTKWVKENLNFRNHEIIENEGRFQGKTEIDDFGVMLSCKYHIISNSSFGWWPAWLSNAELVISPDRWYANGMSNEMILSNWIKIKT